MDSHLHLVVIQNTAAALPNEEPTQISRIWNPDRFDFRWNADYTAFRPIALASWDEASYVRYQSDDDHYAYMETVEPARTDLCDDDHGPVCEVETDEIPF